MFNEVSKYIVTSFVLCFISEVTMIIGLIRKLQSVINLFKCRKWPVVLNKCFAIILLMIFLYIILRLLNVGRNYYMVLKQTSDLRTEEVRKFHVDITKWFLSQLKTNMSILGARLFKQKELVKPQNKTFTILMWHYWQNLRVWHADSFKPLEYEGPMRNCSVRNCIFTENDDELTTADAVIINLLRGDIPQTDNRDPLQRWIFFNERSPVNAFPYASEQPNLKDLANIFNWSMTYRSDADIPVPYGRTVPLKTPVFKSMVTKDITGIIPNWKKKKRDTLAAMLFSSCEVNFKFKLVEELRRYTKIHVFASCQFNNFVNYYCPEDTQTSNCEPLSEYLFFFAFENSYCHEYLTEKIWYYAYSKGAIPIILGPSIKDCNRLLPPNSFIHISRDSNITMKELAYHIEAIGRSDDSLLALHQWRNHFEVYNEHGYYGTYSNQLCRVCEAMNYNDPAEKIYTENDLRWFLDPKLTCKMRNE